MSKYGNNRASLFFLFSPHFRFCPAPILVTGVRFSMLTLYLFVQNVPSNSFPPIVVQNGHMLVLNEGSRSAVGVDNIDVELM